MDRITKAVEMAKKAANQVEVMPIAPSRSDENVGVSVREISISKEVLARHHIILEQKNDPFSHAYKVLRTRIWQQMRKNGWTTMGVTSANPGEGKTLTAINLAISLALMEVKHTVVLVDLDLRRPSIHDYFGFWPENGIADYFQAQASIDDVIVDPGIGEFLMLPGNIPVQNSSEIISSARMQRLFQELRARFPSRLVIFDLPPVLLTDDVLALAPAIDAFLFVIEEGGSCESDIVRAVDLLKDVHMLGTVLNKAEYSSQHYGY